MQNHEETRQGDRRHANRDVALRTHREGDIGWIIQRHGELYFAEYGWNQEFGALVAEIGAAFLREYDPGCEGCWLAEVDGKRAGSVMCVRVDDQTAKLRLCWSSLGHADLASVAG